MNDKRPDLSQAYALKSPDDNRRLYADWAEDYDQRFARDMQYALPQAVAACFAAQWVQGPVLDLGAGTGLLGQALSASGVTPVDATDLSPEMLARARDKGVYRRLFVGNLLDRLATEDGTYDGAVSSGTFTHGHVGPSALTEVLRVLAPGGLAVLSVNAAHFKTRGFDLVFETFRAEGRITGLTFSRVPIYGPGAPQEHRGDMAVLASFRRG